MFHQFMIDIKKTKIRTYCDNVYTNLNVPENGEECYNLL